MNFTSRIWYGIAFLVAAIAWSVGAAYAASAWNPLRTAEVTVVGQDLSPNGQEIAIFTDVVQADRKIECSTRGREPRVEARPAPVEITVASGGTNWHLIGVVEGAPDGVRIKCRPADGSTDTARYGTVVADLSSRGGTAKTVVWGGFAAGLAIAGLTVAARTRKELAHD